MSIQAMTQAFALKDLGPTEKLLMLALSNYADEDMACWPSQRRLAVDTCMGERTVRGLLRKLEDRGLIVREERCRNDGSRMTDRIILVFDSPRQNMPGVRLDVPPPPASDAGLTTFEPSLNHQDRTGKLKGTLRGSRLADDWTPSDADLETASSEGLTPEETNREADKFRDYWRACPGAKGVKLDWPGTWRNWVRKAADYKRERAHRLAGGASPRGGGSGASSFADVIARRRFGAG